MNDRANQPETQTIKTFLVCPCGTQATVGYAFPGQPERGLCEQHKNSVEMRRELSPGRSEVASVRRLDAATGETRHELAAAPPVEVTGDTLRELNWTKSQLAEAKEQIAELKEDLESTAEQLAAARAALGQHEQHDPQT